MKKLDKKQIPQFAVLCVLTVAVFGWFAMKMILPTPAAAQSARPAAAVQKPVSTVAATSQSPTTVVPGAPAPADSLVLPPPAAIRDPFAVAYTDTPAAAAQAIAAPATAPKPEPAPPIRMVSRLPAPTAPELPQSLGNFSISASGNTASSLGQRSAFVPQPAALSPPSWTVTGVLQSDAEQVAILRNGDARRIVRAGDMVDSQFRVVAVTRSSVVLGHAGKQYSLMLGGAAPMPVSPSAKPVPPPAAQRVPGTPLLAAPAMTARPQIFRPLTQLRFARLALPSLRLVQTAALTPKPSSHLRTAAFTPKWVQFHIASTSQNPLFADARSHLELGLALYQSGRHAEGRLEWRKVLTMDDFDSADEAGKLLYRYS